MHHCFLLPAFCMKGSTPVGGAKLGVIRNYLTFPDALVTKTSFLSQGTDRLFPAGYSRKKGGEPNVIRGLFFINQNTNYFFRRKELCENV